MGKRLYSMKMTTILLTVLSTQKNKANRRSYTLLNVKQRIESAMIFWRMILKQKLFIITRKIRRAIVASKP
ncbi:hypothetical protein [Oceanobacillus luteolus]|uniref:hypothetical protein n=1 Tax=Oceanobacillus luteolus TaxID=1274358 RepID=UPI0036D3EE5B